MIAFIVEGRINSKRTGSKKSRKSFFKKNLSTDRLYLIPIYNDKTGSLVAVIGFTKNAIKRVFLNPTFSLTRRWISAGY